MTEFAREDSLPHEALHQSLIMDHGWIYYLERARFTKVNVFGLVDGGHATQTYALDDAILFADDGARSPQILISQSDAVFQEYRGIGRTRRVSIRGNFSWRRKEMAG